MSEMKANCFVCNREIVLGTFCDMTDDEKKDNPCDAVDAKIVAGYGSCHDGMYGKIYICDGCFADRLDRVIDEGDYLEEAANASDALIEAADVVEKEMTKLSHPSNKGFWDKIQNKFWEGQ